MDPGIDLGRVRHNNSRYAFLVSSPLDLRRGYGTAAAVLGLMGALHRKGKRVGLLEPSPLPGSDLFRSWWFNRHVSESLDQLDVDCVVGVDFDGYKYAKRTSRKPFVSLLHGVKADEVLWEEGGAKALLARQVGWERQAALHADLVVAPSLYACRRACETYGIATERTRVVPNGLDLDHWPPMPQPTGPPTVTAAARLVRRKGLDLLIRAWPEVRRAVPDARLEIMGDGPERNALEALASGQEHGTSVHFHGVLSQSEFRSRLFGTQVFCFPSRQEAFGLAMLEAMATERAVLCAQEAALPEVGGDAVHYAQLSPGSVAEGLVRLLSDESLRVSCAKRARIRAESFSWDRAAASFGEALSGA